MKLTNAKIWNSKNASLCRVFANWVTIDGAWLKEWQVHHCRRWLGCAIAGLPSLSSPGWDTIPGVIGGCCPPVVVDAGDGCCPLGGSDIDWARKRQFSG